MFITVIMLITELSLRCIRGRLGGEMAKEDLGEGPEGGWAGAAARKRQWALRFRGSHKTGRKVQDEGGIN